MMIGKQLTHLVKLPREREARVKEQSFILGCVILVTATQLLAALSLIDEVSKEDEVPTEDEQS